MWTGWSRCLASLTLMSLTACSGLASAEDVDPLAAMSAGTVADRAMTVASSPPPATQATSAAKADTVRTRFLIGLEKTVEFDVSTLTNPNRVVIELPDISLRLPEQPKSAVGLVSGFRGGKSGAGKTRVVIDVTEPVVVDSSRIEASRDGKTHQLALEIVATRSLVKTARKPFKIAPYSLGATGLAVPMPQPPLPQRAIRPDVMKAKAYRPIIVIDPGHGGDDSGAVKNGAVEKDVVLAFAKVLRDKIEATGRYKVLMTRDTDTFIPLDERRAFAERHNAALFIAVHADYATTRARGATIYSLREKVAQSLKRSAKGDVSDNVLSSDEVTAVKKVGEGDEDVSVVRNILADLAQREVDMTVERTNILSRSVIEYMGETTKMRDDPDQQAAFRVLKTAQFPSVLIELAYVTNKEDAEQLKSTTWREKVADSITTAVENYFSYQIARLPM